jgi:hypothetical protein
MLDLSLILGVRWFGSGPEKGGGMGNVVMSAMRHAPRHVLSGRLLFATLQPRQPQGYMTAARVRAPPPAMPVWRVGDREGLARKQLARQGSGQKVEDQEGLPYEIRPGQQRPKAVASPKSILDPSLEVQS